MFFVQFDLSLQKIQQIAAENEQIWRTALFFAGINAVCIAAVLWTTLTHRYIDFGKETVRFRLRWLFFQRQWPVPRIQTGVFCLTFFSVFRSTISLPYRRKFFAVPASEAERNYIFSRVNRYLWENPPDSLPAEGELLPDTVIGGIDEPNVRIADETEDGYYFIEPVPHLSEEEQCTLPELPFLTVEQTGETLRIDYTPKMPTLADKLFTCIGVFFLIGLFLSLPLIPLLDHWQEGLLWNCIRIGAMSILMFPVFGIFGLFVLFTAYNDWRQKYASWTMLLGKSTFEVIRRYKNITETAEFDLEDIAAIRRGEPVDEFLPSCGFPVFGRFPPLLCNRGSHRLELILTDGTVEYLPQLPFKELKDDANNNRLCNVLNGFIEAVKVDLEKEGK